MPSPDRPDEADGQEPENTPHEPLSETPDDIPEGQAEPNRSEPLPGAPPTAPADPPSDG
jgi:hypothetical protein